jgi:hypothetical protein
MIEQDFSVDDSGPDDAAPSASSRWWENRWVIPAAALAVGLSVGAAIGAGVAVLSSDPTQTQEYRTLQKNLDTALGEIGAAESAARRAADRARVAGNEAAEREAAVAVRQRELGAAEQAVAAREAAVTAVEQQIAANSIENGIWTVGVDVEPGTYRVAEALTGYCYWGIYASGTNGDDIIENDGPTGGFPTVQLREGQDFENNGCGTFVKQ